jgi:hypothetical protein
MPLTIEATNGKSIHAAAPTHKGGIAKSWMLRCGSDAGLATPMTRCSKSTNPGPNGLTEIMLEPKIDRHNLIAQIRAHFPELEESYQREHEKWEKGAGRDGWL